MKNKQIADKTTDTLQRDYDLIHRWFKTTTEPYDKLDWDGTTLHVLLRDKVVEQYTYSDLKRFIPTL
jgi:hypothetical protein